MHFVGTAQQSMLSLYVAVIVCFYAIIVMLLLLFCFVRSFRWHCTTVNVIIICRCHCCFYAIIVVFMSLDHFVGTAQQSMLSLYVVVIVFRALLLCFSCMSLDISGR